MLYFHRSLYILLTLFLLLCSLQTVNAAPGGVGGNLRIWLDADKGITGTTAITQWNDQSGNGKHVTQNTAANQPSLNTASSTMNFHQSIELDGDRDYLQTSGVMPNDSDDMTFFIVTAADQSSGEWNQLIGMGSSFDYPHIGFNDNANEPFYSNGNFLLNYFYFSDNEPMRFHEPLIFSGSMEFNFFSSPAYNYLNGRVNSSVPSISLNSSHEGDDNFAVGSGGDDNNEDLDGRITEVILYNKILNTTERHQVDSYLAIKYGLTLTNNYLNSIAATIYTLDGTYNNGVFGLGKDTAGSLDQRISRSFNDASGLILSTDTNFTLANTSHADTLSDGDYLLTGHDNGSVISTQTSDLGTGFDKRIIREWKVQNTNSVGAINLQFGTLPTLATGESYALIGDNDGNFSTGSTVLKYSNNTSFSDVTFPVGTSYFTIAIITNKIEFTLSSNNDSENSGGNLPAIAVFGYIPTTTAVTLNLTGTATNSTDYTTPTLSIPAGIYDGLPASNLTLTNFSIIDDTLAETDETTIIALNTGGITDFVIGDANNDTATQNAFTYTIIDEDISVAASGSLIIATDSSANADGIDTGIITLQLKESDGDNISLAAISVSFAISSGTGAFTNNLTTFTTTTNTSGIASASVKSTVAGSINIIATVDRDEDGGTTPEEAVTNDSPVSVSFLAKPVSAANTTISVSPASITTDGGASSTITVQAKDADGLNITSSAGIVTLAEDSATAILTGVSYIGAGAYTATITNTVAETVTISGTIDGNAITSGNKTITFKVGAASATTTTLSASPTTLRANGTDTSVITIQAIDAQGNLLIAGGDTITLSNDKSALIGSIIDNSNGTYTATVTNTEIETTTITGKINKVLITSTSTLTFVANGPALVNDSDGQFINGTAPPGTTITVKNSDGITLCSTIANASTGYYHCVITDELTEGEILTIITTDLAGNDETSTTTVILQDSDNDGISDVIESLLKLNGGSQNTSVTTDTDNDHLPDYAEVILGSDYLSINSPVFNGHLDTDIDGVANSLEFFFSELGGAADTELFTDTDADGLPDITELSTDSSKFYNANYPTVNGSLDDDSDNLSNAVEAYLQKRSINNLTLTSDYDGDGYSDALEIRLASNPLFANEDDSDNDGVNNAIEAFLTGTTNDAGDTVLNDRDADELPDIFELSALTDLLDPASDINYADNGDADSDGITDAVEVYLYGNTTEATASTDKDSDSTPDIIEISVGSNPFITSKPSIWIDLNNIASGEVEIRGNVAGFQSPPLNLSWDLSDILIKQPNITATYPTPRTVRISGLELGVYTIKLTESRWLNGVELSSQIDYSFNIKTSTTKDSDYDAVPDDYDHFDGLTGKEESLHTSLSDTTRYYLQTLYGQIARLGSIARLANNATANITATQIEETVEFGYPITQGSPSSPQAIDSTANIFDFEILNMPEIGTLGSVVIPLHQPIPESPMLLNFDISSSLWSFFKITEQDTYSSSKGAKGICPPLGDILYTQGLTTGHYCIQLHITDGSDNDVDHQLNGVIRHISGIGSGNSFPEGSSAINNPESKEIASENTVSNDTSESENTVFASSDSAESKGGGGSFDHFMLALLSIFALSLVSSAKAAPQGGKVVHGSGAIISAPNQTTITQGSSRLAIDWQAFNVAESEGVTFVQPNGSSIALNRDFSGSPSQLFGSINANGQVLLLNSAGILIGETASINVGSFLASDLETSIEDFSQGNFTLSDNNQTQGGIINLGDVQSTGGSGIYIAGQFIRNSGTLSSSNGHIHLATANEIIVSAGDDGLLGIQLTQPLVSDISPSGDLIYNNGDIVSFNGNIYLDLYYSDTIKANTVNNEGIINAIGITEGNGQIFLTSNSASIPPESATEINNLISSGLTNNTVANSGTSIEIALETQPKVSINTIMPDCSTKKSADDDTECSKYQAIKRYLSRLLLGGELPD